VLNHFEVGLGGIDEPDRDAARLDGPDARVPFVFGEKFRMPEVLDVQREDLDALPLEETDGQLRIQTA
jgi:hypothetical protein